LTFILTLLAWAATFLGLMGGFYALYAALTVSRFFAAAPGATSNAESPAVSILKPLKNAEPGLREALESFCRQDYAGPVQIVCGVLDQADPAIEVVRGLQADRPDLDIVLVIDDAVEGANLKISNLIHIARQARHGVLVVSDCDISAPPDYLSRIVAALQTPGIGVVTSLYVGHGRQGLWSQLSAMAINYQFLPNVVLGYSLALAEPCMGSTLALTTGLLARLGGFEAFRDHLADDYQLGRAARELGYHIALPTLLVDHGCDEKTAGELISHELRWGRTIRLIDGAGYFGAIVTHGFPLALIGAALNGFSAVSVALVVAILLSRLILKLRIDAVTRTKAGSLWLVPLRDVLSFVVFLASLTGSSVTWRGVRYRVGPDGLLSHL
jgi:ceramide glucosyltransferase